MLEDQRGSSDITQSIEANVIVAPYSTSPADESLRRCRWSPGDPASPGTPGRSAATDQRLTRYITSSQITKYAAARTRKKPTFRYGALCWRAWSWLTTAGSAQT